MSEAKTRAEILGRAARISPRGDGSAPASVPGWAGSVATGHRYYCAYPSDLKAANDGFFLPFASMSPDCQRETSALVLEQEPEEEIDRRVALGNRVGLLEIGGLRRR